LGEYIIYQDNFESIYLSRFQLILYTSIIFSISLSIS